MAEIELNSKLQRFFDHSPPKVPKERLPEYFLILISGMLGVLFNLSLIALFYICDVPIMAAISFVSVFLWSTAILANYQGEQRLAISISVFEIIAHTIIAVSILGTDYGFQFFIWAALCLISLNPQLKRKEIFFFGGICLFIFIFLYLIFIPKTSIQPFGGFASLVFVFMIFVAAGSLLTGLLAMKSVFIRQKVQLEFLANHDPLTGLYNRGHFYTFLNKERANATTENTCFCLVLADIDHFKLINDTYGHDVGDEVLKEISALMKKSLDANTFISRWGGEEFLIYVPLNIQLTSTLIESLRDKIEMSAFSEKGLKVTMSFGISELKVKSDDNAYNPDACIKSADLLLYQAKQNGRNTVESILQS